MAACREGYHSRWGGAAGGAASGALGGHRRPLSPAPVMGRGTGMITISKVILSGAAPGQIRDQASGLASAPLRDLAAELAADPDLTVSVITYQDGSQELEVLHAGPPHRDENTIDRRRFTRQPSAAPARTFAIAGPADLHDAVNLIRAVLRDAATA